MNPAETWAQIGALYDRLALTPNHGEGVEERIRLEDQIEALEATLIQPNPTTLTDTRPRVSYSLPDGSIVRIVFDEGDTIPTVTSYQVNGQIVEARRVGL